MKIVVPCHSLRIGLDTTNRARGVVTSIILDPNEPPLEGGSVVALKCLPNMTPVPASVFKRCLCCQNVEDFSDTRS